MMTPQKIDQVRRKLSNFLKEIEAPVRADYLGTDGRALKFQVIDYNDAHMFKIPDFLKHRNFFAPFEQEHSVKVFFMDNILKVEAQHNFDPENLSDKFKYYLKVNQIPLGAGTNEL